MDTKKLHDIVDYLTTMPHYPLNINYRERGGSAECGTHRGVFEFSCPGVMASVLVQKFEDVGLKPAIHHLGYIDPHIVSFYAIDRHVSYAPGAPLGTDEFAQFKKALDDKNVNYRGSEQSRDRKNS